MTEKSKFKTKRLIAQMITAVMATGFVASASVGMVYAIKGEKSLNDINKYNEDKSSLIALYESSKEFENIYKQKVQEATNLYANDEISYKAYTEQLRYLSSQEFIESVIHKSEIGMVRTKLNEINSKLDKATKTYNKDEAITAKSGALMGASGFGAIFPLVPLCTYLGKQYKPKDNTKKEDEIIR